MTTTAYVGSELELFADARNWKAYLRRQIAPHLGQDVLEVGAGIGSFARAAAGESTRRWVCLEPDPGMHAELARMIRDHELPACCEAMLGGVESVPDSASFDSVVYIDVLEHIEDDADELRRALRLLRAGGALVVMSPAHQSLYSGFDKSIGHFRRYSKTTLSKLTPPGASLVRLIYLDSAGLLASLANRVLLRQAMPTHAQVAFWDRVLVRISMALDPILLRRIGKSVLGVWRRDLP